jgi:hypothetical protein
MGSLTCRQLIVGAVIALVVPSLGLAARSPTPGHSVGTRGRPAPKVVYVLRGRLVAYAAANGTTDGSVAILVKSSNHHRSALKGETLKFDVSPATRVVVRGGGVLAVLDKGIVKVVGPKSVGPSEDIASVLQARTPLQVIDLGSSS